MASIRRCHRRDPGSIPGREVLLSFFLAFLCEGVLGAVPGLGGMQGVQVCRRPAELPRDWLSRQAEPPIASVVHLHRTQSVTPMKKTGLLTEALLLIRKTTLGRGGRLWAKGQRGGEVRDSL